MNISTALRLPISSYFPPKQSKDLIVLHHAVGGAAKSTFDYWCNDGKHIATAYIVDRDGTIHEISP